MTRFIALCILLIGIAITPAGSIADPKEEGTGLIFNPGKGDTSDFPKKPAYCPFSGVINEFSLTLFSTISGEVEIVVEDAEGMIVFEDTAELFGGYVIPLEEGIEYGAVYLTIGSRTFVATL